VFNSALEAAWGLFLIVIILGGIYGGVFTPTEAAAVAALYAFLVAFFVYRDMGPLSSRPWLQESEKSTALLGARVWGFAAVALILYASLAGMVGFSIWTALIGVVAFIAVVIFAAKTFVERPEIAGTVTIALIVALTAGPLLVIQALGGGLGGGALLSFGIFLGIAGALLAFALRTGAEALATTSLSFADTMSLGGKVILRGMMDVVRLFIPAFVSRANRDALFEGGKLTVTLLFIIANALILKHVLTDEQIPQSIANSMLDAGFGPVMFLVIVNVILLIGGQFMEPSGLIIIVAPLVFPIAISLGIDPIHLGIIMVVNMEIGMITPPVGLNLFVTSGVAGMPMMRVVKAAMPWLSILFVFLIMVTYIPWLSTYLPTTFMGPEIIIK
jgi:C4-dicarboxylate transporter DctM subunit